MLVHQLIYQHSSDKIAVIDKEPITYGQLQSLVKQYRNFFYQQGVRPSDNVGLFYKNSLSFICSYLAIASLGAVVVPLNIQLTAREIAYIVQNAGMRTLVTSKQLNLAAELVKYGYQKNVLQLVLPEIQESLMNEDIPAAPVSEAFDPNHICTIIYTSGTTGYPKGAMLTHNNLVSNAVDFSSALKIVSDDHILCVLPMFHCFAWTVAVLNVLAVGATVSVLEMFNIRETLATIRERKITVFYGIPTMYKFFTTWGTPEDFESIRVLVSGGASLPENILKQFEEKIGKKIAEGYGLSEASPVVAVNPINKIKPCSIGLPLQGIEAKIIDETDKPLPIGQVGELIVRGPNVMYGYFNLPEESAAALRNGWLHTGDLAYQDEDGYLFIVDRLKDMIITSGENIYPREIEEVLYSYPNIVEAAVIGIPDELRGHAVRAYIVAAEGQKIDKKVLKEYLQANLAAYKVPKDFAQVDSLPKNSTGKILKTVLREQAGNFKRDVG